MFCHRCKNEASCRATECVSGKEARDQATFDRIFNLYFLDQHYDFFVVGHAAPEETITEMIAWIRVKYTRVKILALNPPHQQLLNADYNVTLNGPENWLPIVTLHS